MIKPTILLLLLSFTTAPRLTAQQPAEKEVLAALDRLFEGMTKRDTALSRAVILPGAVFYSTLEGKTRIQPDTSYLSGLTRGSDKWVEKVYKPTVLIHQDLATVWGRYDFFVNDKRSHCGVDTFTFLRTESGWRMANVSYTVERTGCPD